MNVLTVNGLCKQYPGFQLKDVAFSVRPGSIMGFIGRNGAGKTTTLKCLQNLVHPDNGAIEFFGRGFTGNEREIKQKVGFALGGVNYYTRKKLRTITGVYRRFYETWDEGAYQKKLAHFKLDEDKKPHELSEGMKVKYQLALALSHKAKLLMLDEPTSGLDPVSRDELLETFMDLVEDGETSILFSTHLTSDLEKCADDITYIKDGEIIMSVPRQEMQQGYRLVSGEAGTLSDTLAAKLIGCKTRAGEFSALLPTADAALAQGFATGPACLEDIMVYTERE